jgi:DNA-binding PadR family transcriptional regulator
MSIVDSQGRVNGTAAALLGLLRRFGPMTGGELMRAAGVVVGDYWPITRSQAYRELAALAERNLVTAGPLGPRDARPFAITSTGDAAFRAWLASDPGEDTVRVPLLLRLIFSGALEPGRLAGLLDAYEHHHRAQLENYRELHAELQHREFDAAARATLSYGIFHEQAVLAWLESLPPELRAGKPAEADRDQ